MYVLVGILLPVYMVVVFDKEYIYGIIYYYVILLYTDDVYNNNNNLLNYIYVLYFNLQ